ncbi:NADH dehydrogenase [ubiquinone] flavoprotein 3, mitochondrial [Eublepharis macularius]|uniref:NADH dehydrogenase [ubiquinone] flavoprotein 3, mitochondrial n=1 Tax=Eublepharis macularius TaxID=481883 RepID=A0AA97KT80_EUBMA|nr:NADH dehydrogenase [ubiquinone] flavoprotein 3, mitochondrial [Eublepharis macularius]
MAFSLLVGCGRGAALKVLKLQAWNLQCLPSTVSLCTKPGDSEKGSTKNKSENIISTIPEEAVKLTDEEPKKFWPSKTLVTFPQRVIFPSLEREPGFSSTGGSSEKPDEESSSSSSSESDSSSDSDEEDNIIKDSLKTKVVFPRRDPISSEVGTMKEDKVNDQQFPRRQKGDSEPEKLLYSPIIIESPIKRKGGLFPKEDPVSSDNRTVKLNTSKQHFPQPQNDHAPQNLQYSPRIIEPPIKEKELYQTAEKLVQSELAKHAIKQTSKETHLKGTDLGLNSAEIQDAESQRPTAKKLETSPYKGAPNKLCETQQQSVMTHGLNLLSQEENAARGVQEAEAHKRAGMEVQEKLFNDTTTGVEATMKQEITLETGIQTEQQSTATGVKAAVETAQEATDISTYKNLQHHEYTPFTFVDYDVELSKFRLPQPSSGKISPQH